MMNPSQVTLRSVVSGLIVVCTAALVTSGTLVAGAAPGGDALARLKAGNARFVANPREPLPIDAARRAAQADGQTPLATVLSCADARVPPEVVFHAGLGELFVVRALGNVTDRAILGSIEHAVERLHTPLVVVMGHESCDVVKLAAETPAGQASGPNLDYLLSALRPSLAAHAGKPDAERLRGAILDNVEESLNDMITGSAVLRDAGDKGTVTFVGAYYELSSGRVYFSEPVALGPLAEPRLQGEHH